jgi:hypothetical protein
MANKAIKAKPMASIKRFFKHRADNALHVVKCSRSIY